MGNFFKELRDFFFRGYETAEEKREDALLDFLIMEREQLYVEPLFLEFDDDDDNGPYCR